MLDKTILRPVECPNLVRLGPQRDGGYVVPVDHVTRCRLLISLGLSDDWSFDRDFLARNSSARVVGVDHTVGPLWFIRRILLYSWKLILHSVTGNREKRAKYSVKLKNAADYFSFFGGRNVHLKKRISTGGGQSDITLGSIFTSNPTDGETPDVFLKMDIEGAEYEMVNDIIDNSRRISCIAAELHDLDTRTEEFNRFIRLLTRDFYVVHIHGNNGAAFDRSSNFPSVIEMTLVNKSDFSEEPKLSKDAYPKAGIDYPNNPGAPDYELSFD